MTRQKKARRYNFFKFYQKLTDMLLSSADVEKNLNVQEIAEKIPEIQKNQRLLAHFLCAFFSLSLFLLTPDLTVCINGS